MQTREEKIARMQECLTIVYDAPDVCVCDGEAKCAACIAFDRARNDLRVLEKELVERPAWKEIGDTLEKLHLQLMRHEKEMRALGMRDSMFALGDVLRVKDRVASALDLVDEMHPHFLRDIVH